MTKSRTSNSSVCRVHKNANYTVMSNYHLQSRNLSLKAIGLLSKVFSLPDDWDYSIAGLTCICKENETAIKSALNELKEWGYLTVTKLMPSETKVDALSMCMTSMSIQRKIHIHKKVHQ